MIQIVSNIIIKEQIVIKTQNINDPILGESVREYSAIEYDILDENGDIIETWDWEIDPNNLEIPTVEELCDRTGIKFGVSKWEFPDETTL